ncbi:MAG: hypothetical protein C0616_05140 [Desulfuromonas sp.]|nr:MAG: hypothetical protein C0616_05140 [Desulfuromonas sp.]
MPSSTNRRRLLALLWPGGLTLFLASLIKVYPAQVEKVGPFVYPALCLLVLFGSLLCWRLNRTRLLFALLLLFLTDRTLYWTGGTDNGSITIALLSFALPLNLCLFSLLRETGLFAIGGLLRMTWLGLLGAAGTWVISERKQTFQDLVARDWIPLTIQPADLSDPALVTIILTALILFLRFWKQPTPQNGGLLAVLFLSCAGLFSLGGIPATTWFALGALTLVLATVESFHALAYRDELTNLPGRRAMQESLEKLGGHYTIAMVDIDFFKRCNDKYGHDVGDQVLKMVSKVLENVTGGGKAFRYGGEEFAVLFSRRTLEETVPHLETLRERIAETGFQLRHWSRPPRKPKGAKKKSRDPRLLKVTVSIGAAQRGKGEKPGVVLKRADQNLYKAKKGGRNQVKA